MASGATNGSAGTPLFRSIQDCTVTPDGIVERTGGDSCAVVCSVAPIRGDTAVVFEVMEKYLPFVDNLTSKEPLEIGFSSTDPLVTLTQVYQCHSYQLTNSLGSLESGHSLAFMYYNKAVHVFVGGICRERTPISHSPPFWAVVSFCGRFKKGYLSLAGCGKKEYICTRIITLQPHSIKINSGTAVNVYLLKNQKFKRSGDVWITWTSLEGTTTEGWISFAYLASKSKEILNSQLLTEGMSRLMGCNIMRILCIGPPQVGKKLLKRLLLQQEPQPISMSTPNSAHPLLIRVSNNNKEWHVIEEGMMEMVAGEVVDSPSEPIKDLPHVRDVYQPKRTASSPGMSPPSPPLLSQVDPTRSLPTKLTSEVLSPQHERAASFTKQQTYNMMSLRSLPPTSLPLCTTQKQSQQQQEMKHIVYFSSLSSQPHIFDLLPIFIRRGMMVIFVTDVRQDFSTKPSFMYDDDNEHTTPSIFFSSSSYVHTMRQTYWQMIESTARVVSSYSHSPPYSTPSPNLLVVGSHVDKLGWMEKKKRLNEINTELRKRLHSLKGIRIDYDERHNQVLFPMNISSDRDNIAGIIRKKVTESQEKSKVNLPVNWCYYGLALTREFDRPILTLDECISRGQSLGISPEEVKQILIFFDFVDNFMYLPHVNDNVLITDCQLILDMLSSLLKVTFCDTGVSLPPNAITKLTQQGLFTREVFEICLMDYSTFFTHHFTVEHLLEILEHLFILGKIPTREDYFIPIALKTCDNLYSIKSDYQHFDHLLLIPTPTGVLLQGVFTALIIRLISLQEFTLDDKQVQYRNAITLTHTKGGCILLIDHFQWLEVCYPVDNNKEAFRIKRTITDSISSLTTVLPYSSEDLVVDCGFMCDFCPAAARSDPHPAVVKRETIMESSFILSCTKQAAKTKTDTSPKRLPWLFSLEHCHSPELHEYMTQVARKLRDDQWEVFGIQLKLNTTTLRNIESRRFKASDRYIDIYDEWHRTESLPFTWKTILDALKEIQQNDVRRSLITWLREKGKLNLDA